MSAPHPHALHTNGEIALDAKALDETRWRRIPVDAPLKRTKRLGSRPGWRWRSSSTSPHKTAGMQ
jgi:hypothetical protein